MRPAVVHGYFDRCVTWFMDVLSFFGLIEVGFCEAVHGFGIINGGTYFRLLAVSTVGAVGSSAIGRRVVRKESLVHGFL